MFTKKSIFVLLIVLTMGTLIHAQSKGTIAFAMRMDTTVVDTVTGEFPDMTWVHALEDSGYEVIQFYTPSLFATTQDTLDILLNADLIVLGRSVPTSTLGGNSPDDKIAWNDLPVPMLTGNMWAVRSSRLNWFNSTTITSYTDEVVRNASIIDPNDPILTNLGLNTSEPIPWWDGPMDAIGTTDAGSGILIAAGEIDGNCWYVRFDPEVEFYPNAIDYPAGYRTFLGNGRDNSSLPPFDYYNFTPESEKVFYAEVASLIKLGGGPSDVRYWGKESLPLTSVLLQNYPNPFNPTTKIQFSINDGAYTNLTVYNSLGQKIETLIDKELNSGRYDVTFDAANLPSGIYLYQIHSGSFNEARKMILMK